jgi:hypothetical protein
MITFLPDKAVFNLHRLPLASQGDRVASQKRTADSRQQTAGSRQQTAEIRQLKADSGYCTADSRQQKAHVESRVSPVSGENRSKGRGGNNTVTTL